MPVRTLTTHQVNELNEALTIRVVDEPGQGGANHRYKIDGPLRHFGQVSAPAFQCDIKFQQGPPAEGINGISNEALLAVLEDRLRGFHEGPFACDENYLALQNVRNAMAILQLRTRQRMARGVEGTHQL